MSIAAAFGAAIRAARRTQGLTLEEVARRVGSHRPIVGRVERGLHMPRLGTMQRYMKAVHLTAYDLKAVVDALSS